MPEPSVFVTNPLKRDLARVLEVAWRRYTEFFGEPPHGTSNQMQAFVGFMKLDAFVDGIANHAVARWYAEGQGSSHNQQNTSLVTSVGRLDDDDEVARALGRTLHLDDEEPDDDDEPCRDHGR